MRVLFSTRRAPRVVVAPDVFSVVDHPDTEALPCATFPHTRTLARQSVAFGRFDYFRQSVSSAVS